MGEMTGTTAPAALRTRLVEADSELALLDVREPGGFAHGHILLASNAPLNRLEIDVPRLVPRRAAPIVICDGGEGLAERAAAILARGGYRDLAVLDGGIPAWRDAGFALFDGIYVPSKAFGEFVEAAYGTPHIAADELAQLSADGTNLIVLDSRPMDEYRAMNIPGGIDVPGAELVHRIHDLAPDPETLVVVNCAGRTRSIIGAQSLINAGVANRVVALENGTMGWTLAGHDLEHGQARMPPPLSAAGRHWAKTAAARVAARFGVPTIEADRLARWRDEAETCTLYVCDVRSPAEYETGHLPDALCTPGGQLVQTADSYLGTRGARVVLVDDDGVRATMTASWLIQMGWRDVFVLQPGQHTELVRGPQETETLGLDEVAAQPTIEAKALAELTPGDDVRILDLADRDTYTAGHVPGAWLTSRHRLGEALGKAGPALRYVLTSPDGALASLAAADLDQLTATPIAVLAGGTRGWHEAGLPLREGAENIADTGEDAYLRPYDLDDPERAAQAMRDYLSWETALVPRIEREGTLRFKTYPG